MNLTGQRFGRLVAQAPLDPSLTCYTKWVCQCDCGKTTKVVARSLYGGRTKSCGCLRRESSRQRATKHGLCSHPLYAVHNAMVQRCENPRSKDYKFYGLKGVSVSDDWHDFEKFYAWATESGYTPGLTIDRINPALGYTPDNCRWITIQEQQRNRRNSRCRE